MLMHRAQNPDDSGVYQEPFTHKASTHTLRHTFADTCGSKGCAATADQGLVRSSVTLRTTERFYPHASPERNRRSESLFDEMMTDFERRPKKVLTMVKSA